MEDSTVSQERNKKILFVDDDSHIHRGLNRLLKQQHVSWSYVFAGSVAEALAIMDEMSVDAVISDIKMPERDGFDLLCHLRNSAEFYDLPIVMLTGLDSPGLKSKALDMGATDLLNKPINPEELMARIRSVLHIKQCQDTIKEQNAHLEHLVRQRTEALEATRLDMIWRLGKAAEFKSEETGDHVIRVGYFSRTLAEGLGLSQEVCEMVFLTSPLHDLGKIGTPDRILQKQGGLDDAEWDIMKTHCRIGQELLSQGGHSGDSAISANGTPIEEVLNRESNPFLQMAADIAGFHHEQWQGGGYPYGVKGEEIPLAARIVAVSDVYDALRSKRCYKSGLLHNDVLGIMRKENGIRFDPAVFGVFERSLAKFTAIHEQYYN
jgi:putative two-component system response regulator